MSGRSSEFQVPGGCGVLDVKRVDNGDEMESTMIAGMAGYKVVGKDNDNDTLQPFPGWFIFTKDAEMVGLWDEGYTRSHFCILDGGGVSHRSKLIITTPPCPCH